MDLAVLVPLADVGHDLGLGEVADALLDEAVLVGQGEVDHGRQVPLTVLDGRPSYRGGRPRAEPILGRWTPRRTCRRSSAATSSATGATARATGCSTPAARRTSTSPAASRPPHSATATRGSPRRSTSRSTIVLPDQRARVHGAGVAARGRAGGHDARRARHGLFLNSGAEAIEAALKLRAASPAGRGSSRSRTASTAGRSVPSASRRRTSTTGPATSRCCPGLHRAVPERLPGFRQRRRGAPPRRWPTCAALREVIPPRRSGRPDRVGPGRGRLHPGAARVHAASCARCATSTASSTSPTRSRPATRAPGRCGASSTPASRPTSSCLAKAIANGLPLSAIVTRRELQDRWGIGAHGSTFGGNPVACAAGVAVLETIREERLVENAAARGAELFAGLKSRPRTTGSATSAGPG